MAAATSVEGRQAAIAAAVVDPNGGGVLSATHAATELQSLWFYDHEADAGGESYHSSSEEASRADGMECG